MGQTENRQVKIADMVNYLLMSSLDDLTEITEGEPTYVEVTRYALGWARHLDDGGWIGLAQMAGHGARPLHRTTVSETTKKGVLGFLSAATPEEDPFPLDSP